MQELWKDIPDYEGLYQISNFGNVRTTKGKTTYTKRHGARRWKERTIKPKISKKDNCSRVELWKDGKHKTWLVHRLVALAFLGEPPNEKYTVNHKDGNRRNNNLTNLEWLTRADNIRHGYKNGLYHTKAVLLKNEHFTIAFPSNAVASRYLHRNSGYINCAITNSRKAKSKNGCIYEIVQVKK